MVLVLKSTTAPVKLSIVAVLLEMLWLDPSTVRAPTTVKLGVRSCVYHCDVATPAERICFNEAIWLRRSSISSASEPESCSVVPELNGDRVSCICASVLECPPMRGADLPSM